MAQRTARGGLAALLILAVAAISSIILVVAWVDSGAAPPSFQRVQEDSTCLIRVENKEITRFHLRVAEQYHKLRAGKDGYVLPDHGILLQFMQVAAWEEILRRHGRPVTPEAVAEERARQIRESRDPAKMREIIGHLDQYPGMFEMIMVRPALANNGIFRLHGDRTIQVEAWEKAERGLKEALRDPDFFRRMKESDPESYVRADSDDPMAGIGKVPLPHLPPHEKEVHQKRIRDFADRHLSTTSPNEVCPNVVDNGDSFIVLRLLERTAERVVYDWVAYRKSLYDVWFEGELKKVKGEVPDPDTRRLLEKNLKDHVFGRWLFPPQ